jgi:DNA topoisomerase-1
VENETQIDYPVIQLGAHPETGAPVMVRIGRFGPYVQIGEGEETMNASIPDDTPPADFTHQRAIELAEERAKGPTSLGEDPETGQPVYLMTGRFGPYVQLGETPEKGSTEKPRRASLTREDSPATMTIDRALELLALPRRVGVDPESGEEIVANFGRYGPYVKRGSEFRSLGSDADVFAVTLDQAVELFKQEKPSRRSASRKVLRELGSHPDSGAAIQLLEGRYGPYVTDGTTNASLPKEMDSASLSLETAVGLLREREGAKPRGRSRGAAPKRSAGGRRAAGRGTSARKPSP